MNKITLTIFMMVCMSILPISGPSAFVLDDVSNLRCDGGIVSIGDSEMEVETKCGSPTDLSEGGDVWV